MANNMLLYLFMTATGHALIGVIIAAKISNPVIAIPLAVISHFAADYYPHWDAGTHGEDKTKQQLRIEAAGDVIFGFILSYLMIIYIFPKTDFLYAFIIIIISQSPDWLTMPYYFFNINFPMSLWIYKLQKNLNSKLDAPWGIISQAAAIVFLVILAKLF